MELKIRDARLEDAEALQAIYKYYVEHTAISFEYEAPTVEEFRRRMMEIKERYPYIVAEEGGRIIGYAYAGPFHKREAYKWSVELTVYLDKDCRGHGCGRRLYEELEKMLRERGFKNLYACIGKPAEDATDDPYLTDASIRFHEKMGFRIVGLFTKCGYKFNRWYDMVWMEKLI